MTNTQKRYIEHSKDCIEEARNNLEGYLLLSENSDHNEYPSIDFLSITNLVSVLNIAISVLERMIDNE